MEFICVTEVHYNMFSTEYEVLESMPVLPPLTAFKGVDIGLACHRFHTSLIRLSL